MKRRNTFPLLSSIPILGSPIGCSAASKKAPRKEESIIIVGAGVSGLGAAEKLRDYGYEDITILEARDRVGGRVCTSRSWENAPVDLGASWIHGPRRNPISRLAREAGLRTMATDFDDFLLFGSAGAEMDRTEMSILRKVERKLYAALGSKSGREAKSLHARFQQGLGDLSEEERAKADYLVNSLIESSYAEDVEYLHPRLLEFGKEFGGGDVLFPEGYSQVFDPRFSKFEVRIDCAVEKVDWGSHGATLTTTQGEHSADRVILTLPLGVLKKGSISFSPGLPDSKLTAINAMGMGCLNKLYLKFPETFWPVDCSGISYQSPKTGHWSQWLNFAPYTRSPILAGFTAGSFARETEQWSDMETVTSAMETLRRLFGSSIPEPVAFQRTRWNSDPYSLGSYSARRPGVGQSMIQALGEPIDGRIFFAGEATSVDYPSTVHGAYLSGQREAERLALA